jgi:hypothetical protein
LLEFLPPESATMTGIRVVRQRAVDRGDLPEVQGTGDPAEGPWSQLEMLVAGTIDELRGLQYMYLMAHSGKGARSKPPERVRRPGLRKRLPRLSMAERLALDPRMRRAASKDLAAERISRVRETMERRARGDDG